MPAKTLDHRKLQRLLRETREAAGLRQTDVAQLLGKPQSYVAKFELGERRLDVIELRAVCHALGTTLPDFIRQLEEILSNPSEKKQPV